MWWNDSDFKLIIFIFFAKANAINAYQTNYDFEDILTLWPKIELKFGIISFIKSNK